jgi:diketogulonate reductase-like aldo/keto reductase
MRLRRFGPLTAEVPVIGQGTWNLDRADRRAAVSAIRRGIDVGLTHLDTAEMYGEGTVESLVGEAIHGRRDEVFLVSKVLPRFASRRGTVASCERSLARLGTDHLDLYLLHWPGSYPLEETIAGFEELREKGRTRAYGVSNFDVDRLEEAVHIAGPGRIVCNQVLYHLKERAIEHRVIPWCRDHGIAVAAYSPFGSGDFPTPPSPGSDVLAAIATAHGATSRQVALAFLTTWSPVFVLPKTVQRARMDENAAAGELTLTSDELGRLDGAFPRGSLPERLPTL